MPIITLPDGSQKTFDNPVSVAEVAASIGSGLADAALLGKVNNELVDTSYKITTDCELAILTDKTEEGLDAIRHSTAHLLAQAVKSIYPTAQVTIGPVIEDGFYYDFSYERSFTPEDLFLIEEKMVELAKENQPIIRKVIARDEAISYFKGLGEKYKAEIIAEIPENQEISLYEQGDFVDLCRGPHVPNTSKLTAFKLTKLAGAYWRGDSNNEMLQRIYGTAWPNKKSLKKYLNRIEEAGKRDHRKIGKALNLFHMQEEAPGMVFWHPKGWTLWQQIESYIRKYLQRSGYQEIKTPQLVDKILWEKSGHWDKFRDDMFVTETENRTYAVKPMSCPCHILIYNQGIKSYRDLPLRLAEFGHCHRCEPSGSLHGLMRVRSMVQDDGHIFCTEEQIQSEASQFIDQVYAIYKHFGFDDIILKIATRPEKRVGSDEIWDKSEQCLIQAVEQKGLKYDLNIGEGAFYGPKIEFSLKDCLDRVWQCGTLQVDFSTPERLGANYIAEDSSKKIPVMLHRAVLGTLERFIGILTEHHSGLFPVWMAPIQAVLINISDNQLDYVNQLHGRLSELGFRVDADTRNEKIGLKIREATLQKVPYMLVVGDREVESNTVSVRTVKGEDCGSLEIDKLITKLENEINNHI